MFFVMFFLGMLISVTSNVAAHKYTVKLDKEKKKIDRYYVFFVAMTWFGIFFQIWVIYEAV